MIFIGREARAANQVTRYELRARHRRIFPDVYGPRNSDLTLRDRAVAAVLWSDRRAVVTGVAASALHGADWVAADAVIELSHPNGRPPTGILTRNETLLDSDVTCRGGLPVTTVERTAFDLARRLPVVDAVARLDALARATHFKVDDVLTVAARYPGVRGCLRVPEVLDLVDEGGHSPQESWLRLVFVGRGYPRPETQLPLIGANGQYYVDMGWREVMVAVEYDGEQHRLERDVYRNDIKRAEDIAGLGWSRLRVIAGDRPWDIVRRAEAAGLRVTGGAPAILQGVRRLGL